jgi:hypothetical protein
MGERVRQLIQRLLDKIKQAVTVPPMPVPAVAPRRPNA